MANVKFNRGKTRANSITASQTPEGYSNIYFPTDSATIILGIGSTTDSREYGQAVQDTAGTEKAFLLGHEEQGTIATTISNANVYMQADKLYSNDSEVVNVADVQTITAVKIFSSGIKMNNTRVQEVGAPTADEDAANKGYVDTKIADIPVGKGSGDGSIVQKSSLNIASDAYSSAFGYNTQASMPYAHAEGHNTKASGISSHAEGSKTTASGESSHAEGYNATASQTNSHAEGQDTKANAIASHAEGNRTIAGGYASHAEGSITTASGGNSHAEGYNTVASQTNSHAEGQNTKAMGTASHAEGDTTTAKGYVSHSEGQNSQATGDVSHAEGYKTMASTYNSHAEGQNTKAEGTAAHSEGDTTTAKGYGSHSEGQNTLAKGGAAHAEGNNTNALGYASHAEGQETTASNTSSHAEGNSTTAEGEYSHAEGFGTEAKNYSEHAEGSFNVSHEHATLASQRTVHSTGIGTSDIDRKNALEVMKNGDVYVIGIGSYDGTNLDTAKTVQEVVSEAANTVKITYADLKSLRDAGKLVPGTQYRITDYTCTTTQSGTKSAGHAFDIIVTADDKSTLNEVARAVKHEGDTYFANSDLNAWKIWYCLDNDTTRFAWADATNGKGIIYRMIDEWNNDVPYDFKNIQFYRKWNADKSLWSTISSNSTGVPCYTFSSEGSSSTTSFTDYSLSASNYVYSNVIKDYVSSKKQILNNICFFGNDCNSNTFRPVCYDNTFGSGCYGNSFGSNCHKNTFGDKCYNNTFGNGCSQNTFGSGCRNNSFGNKCYKNSFGHECGGNTFGNDCYNNSLLNGCGSNSFGDSCSSNSFWNSCYSNTFGINCGSNSFGDSCSSNSFGINCEYNSFGYECRSNSFGNNCEYNSFGGSCWSNVLENYCCHNSFGNSCWSNSFGNSCNYNTFGKDCNYNTLGNECGEIKFASDSTGSTKYDFYQNNHFGDGCQYIIFKGIEGSSENPIPTNPSITNSGSPTPEPPVGLNQVRNYNFSQGIRGTSSDYLTIDGVRGRTYETYISRDTDGTIKESVIAEFENKLGNCVDLTTEQTINAVKTFSAGIDLNGTRISKVGSPVNTDDVANKEYVDNFAATKQDVLTAGKGIVIDDSNTISINLDTDIFKVVPVLPEAPAVGDEKKIHLVPSDSGESGNAYDEYIYVDGSWEKIGSFRPTIDLSEYAEKSYVDSKVASLEAKNTELTNTITTLDTKIAKLENIISQITIKEE